MLISMAILGAVLALVSQLAVGQMRFYRGLDDVSLVRAQTGNAGAIIAAALWGASPLAGDIIAAQDSALEIRATLGASVVCASTPGVLTMAAASARRGNALASFQDLPESGDRVHVLFSDSVGATWLTFNATSPATASSSCALFGGPALSIALREMLVVPVGAAIRITRPIRFSLYRASDSRWYLGAKDWNGTTLRYNTIQPVAGPFRSYATNGPSGLSFIYRDRDGRELSAPIDPSRIASVGIVARSPNPPPGAASPYGQIGLLDSGLTVFALRNAP